MRENRTYGSEGGEASAFPTLSGPRRAGLVHNPQPTTHNPQPTTHNPQPTTHNPQPTTHNPIRPDCRLAANLTG